MKTSPSSALSRLNTTASSRSGISRFPARTTSSQKAFSRTTHTSAISLPLPPPPSAMGRRQAGSLSRAGRQRRGARTLRATSASALPRPRHFFQYTATSTQAAPPSSAGRSPQPQRSPSPVYPPSPMPPPPTFPSQTTSGSAATPPPPQTATPPPTAKSASERPPRTGTCKSPAPAPRSPSPTLPDRNSTRL